MRKLCSNCKDKAICEIYGVPDNFAVYCWLYGEKLDDKQPSKASTSMEDELRSD